MLNHHLPHSAIGKACHSAPTMAPTSSIATYFLLLVLIRWLPACFACDRSALNLFLFNDSYYYWRDACNRSSVFELERWPGDASGACRPQCHLVLHKEGCASRRENWCGEFCPAAPARGCRQSRFRCSEYDVGRLAEALEFCERNVAAIERCSAEGTCHFPAALSSDGTCHRSIDEHDASEWTGAHKPRYPVTMPFENVTLPNRTEAELGDVYYKNYAAHDDVFQSIAMNLYDPYMILLKDFMPCLREHLQVHRIVYLYLPGDSLLFEFGNTTSLSATMTICTLGTPDPRIYVRYVLMLVALPLSIAGLVITMVATVVTGDHRTIPGVNLLCLCGALLTAYLTAVLVNFSRSSGDHCIPESILHVASILGAFAWMNVMAFDIWSTLARVYHADDNLVRNHRRKLIRYCLYGWGVPLVILLAGVAVDNSDVVSDEFRPYFSIACWFGPHNTIGTVIFYYAPVAIALAFNVVAFVLTTCILYRNQCELRRDKLHPYHKHKSLFKLYLKLFLVMGLTWILEVSNVYLPIATLTPELYMASDFLNSLQGFFICLIFSFKQSVWKAFCYHCCPQSWFPLQQQ